MLTKELLEVEKRRPNIQPRYRDIDEYQPAAEQVLDAYETGKTRAQINGEVSELETHDTFKLVRGLSKLLDRRATFEQEYPVEPSRLREAVFDEGFVTSEEERRQVLTDVAADFDLSPREVEENLWADRDEEEVLVSVPEIDPQELLRQYNLSLTQTLLFDALELEFTASDNFQEIFGVISYLGLMYTVDEELRVTVTGPASILKKTRKYGTTLAKLVPSIMKADEWSLSAKVETDVSDETRIYEFTLNSSHADLFPDKVAVESFDSEVERDFATRISSLADGWTVNREPTILRTGNRVMIPDFSFTRNDNDFYLEVIGFWTPEYLNEKLEKVRHVESEKPIMLAVNDSLSCTKEDFEDANVEQVFFYDDQIPVKPVLKRLQAIDEREAEQDLQQLNEQGIEVSRDEIIDIESLAASYNLEAAAIEEYLDENYEGVLSNGKFVPNQVLTEIEGEIDELDGSTLADVNPILEEYGVGQDILEEMGYTVNYVSLNQDEAEIRKTT
ncbi:MAG: putative nuclease of restriction endonuclease-like RecB superfamily [Natrialbaceae archaeon]|jgi:predicted nuclease of restriction endonuclease-like RecB superfamily